MLFILAKKKIDWNLLTIVTCCANISCMIKLSNTQWGQIQPEILFAILNIWTKIGIMKLSR